MQTDLVSSLIKSVNELKALLEVRESELREAKYQNNLLIIKAADAASTAEDYRSRCLNLEFKLSELKKEEPEKLPDEKSEVEYPHSDMEKLNLIFDQSNGCWIYSNPDELAFNAYEVKGKLTLICIGRLGFDGKLRSLYNEEYTSYLIGRLVKLTKQTGVKIVHLKQVWYHMDADVNIFLKKKGLANF